MSSRSFFCAFSVLISIPICFHILLLLFLLFYHKTCTSRKYSKFYTALYCRYIIISASLVMKEVSNALTEVQGYKAKTGSHACLCMSGILCEPYNVAIINSYRHTIISLSFMIAFSVIIGHSFAVSPLVRM